MTMQAGSKVGLLDSADRMNGGVVEQEGSPLDLYDKPASLFVAAFIGSPPMNFLEGDLVDGADLLLADKTRLKLPGGDSQGRPRVTVGIRPEHFVIAEEGWPATVSVVEPTGSETQITARLAGNVVRVLIRGRTSTQPGETIHLTAAPELIHMFDPEPVPELVEMEDVA